MTAGLNILICPLEWGLGHATRMIPVARNLSRRGHRIFFASGEDHLKILRHELPEMEFISFPGFSPGYSRYFPQYLVLLARIPALVHHIIKEHRKLGKLIDTYKIDIVISDNRFGLWTRKVPSAYFTHMPRIPFPVPFRFLEFAGIALHRFIISKYTLCLIPDLPGEINLTGRLSHGFRLTSNTRFTGILSRFNQTEKQLNTDIISSDHDLVILSGPEPQRSLFRELAVRYLEKKERKAYILEGKAETSDRIVKSGAFEFHSQPDSTLMRSMILHCSDIITRSGYTTIMELVSQGRTALLVPTPGQTEQEYLASSLALKGWFRQISQKDLGKEIVSENEMARIPDEFINISPALLDKALDELLEYGTDK